MQRLGRDFTVCDKREPDIARAGIASVRLLPGEVAAGDDPHTCVPVKPDGDCLVATYRRDVEPDTEAAGGTPVAVPRSKNLVGGVELQPVEPAVFLDMSFVVVSGDRDMLDRNGHLRRGNIAQLVKGGKKAFVAGGKADAHARQVRSLRQRLKRH